MSEANGKALLDALAALPEAVRARAAGAALDDAYAVGQAEESESARSRWQEEVDAGSLVLREARDGAEELHRTHDERYPIDTCQRSECQAMARLINDVEYGLR